MEHLPHGELYDYILAKGRLTEAEAARLFGQVVSAIQHLHSVSKHFVMFHPSPPPPPACSARTLHRAQKRSVSCILFNPFCFVFIFFFIFVFILLFPERMGTPRPKAVSTSGGQGGGQGQAKGRERGRALDACAGFISSSGLGAARVCLPM